MGLPIVMWPLRLIFTFELISTLTSQFPANKLKHWHLVVLSPPIGYEPLIGRLRDQMSSIRTLSRRGPMGDAPARLKCKAIRKSVNPPKKEKEQVPVEETKAEETEDKFEQENEDGNVKDVSTAEESAVRKQRDSTVSKASRAQVRADGAGR